MHLCDYWGDEICGFWLYLILGKRCISTLVTLVFYLLLSLWNNNNPHVCECICHGVPVEVREQPCVLGAFFPSLCGLRIKLRPSGLHDEGLYLMSYLVSQAPNLFIGGAAFFFFLGAGGQTPARGQSGPSICFAKLSCLQACANCISLQKCFLYKI